VKNGLKNIMIICIDYVKIINDENTISLYKEDRLMYYTIDGCGLINYLGTDINGNTIQKTLDRYPYSYDAYVTWKGDYNREKNEAVYSDRLFQWDSKKYNNCCKEVWGNESQYFYERNPKEIESFLSKYFEKEIKLTAIEVGCNMSTGYPYWVFYFEDKV
jgi:hypothetical protein